MTMQRYFISNDQWDYNKGQVTISGEDYHHINKVMRMTSGDIVIGCNENEESFELELIQFDDATQSVVATIKQTLSEQVELPAHITLAQGLPKGDKLETIVQKGTELGMRSFIPLQMDRSIVKWDRKKQDKKVNRLQKIAKEASEQSHRLMIPTIQPLQSLSQVLDSGEFDLLIVASEYEAKGDDEPEWTLSDIMNQIGSDQRVLLIIGPEGGISPHELTLCEQAGVLPARLGRRILRTETASLYALSVLSYCLEESHKD